MDTVIPAPRPPSVAVAGDTRRFPVRRVFCVGRNYEAHAKEMGQTEREPPFFFTKAPDAVVDASEASPAEIRYPPETNNLHHEIELVVAIGTGGEDLAVERALGHVWGYASGLDLTRRDLQNAAKDNGRPWDWGKSFDQAAPLGALHPASAVGHPTKGRIWLTVDGQLRQEGDLAEMIWGVAEIVAAISRSMALAPGDLIFTGTPSGVGPIQPGQVVRGGVEGLGGVAIRVSQRSARS